MQEKYAKLTPFLVLAFIVSVEAGISFNSTLLPNIKADFVINDQIAQLTISATLFALGFSGFLYGGLSDCLGRKPLFLFSIVLFSVGALVSALTSSLTIFLIARVLQGFGSGAGWVVGNACLKDIYHGKDYIRVMNHTHAIAGIVPAIAPVAASYLAVIIGWRNCFFILFGFSFLAAISIYLFQPETLAQKKGFSNQVILLDYKKLFTNTLYLKYLAIKVFAVMLLFCEISTLPLVLVDYMAVTPQYYGFYLMPVFLIYVLCSITGNSVAIQHHPDVALCIGWLLILLSSCILVIAEFHFTLSPINVILIKSVCFAGWGFIFGNATSQIVSVIPGMAGMASALMIASEMVFSGIGIFFIGLFFEGNFKPLCIFMICISSLSLFILRFLGVVGK